MNDAQNSEINALFEQWTAPGRPGAAVTVLREGHVIHAAGYGLSSLEHDVPITPRTAFRIASVTKQFTCAIILMLADKGLVDIDAEIQTYLPEVQRYEHPVTVTHLMSNTAGIRDSLDTLRLCGGGIHIPHSHDETVSIIARQSAPNFKAGASYLYSNANFLLLTEIVRQVTKRPLPDLIKDWITEPLGMHDTRLPASYADVIPRLANGYLRRVREDGSTFYELGIAAKALSGEGGMVSTADDLAIWLTNYRDDKLGVIERLSALRQFENGVESGYALGIMTEMYRGRRVFGHGGLWPGYRTEIAYAPELDIAVAVIANVDAIDPHVMARRVFDIVSPDGFTEPAATPVSEASAEAAMAGAPYVHVATGERIGFDNSGETLVAIVFDRPVTLADRGPNAMRFVSGGLELTGIDIEANAVRVHSIDGSSRTYTSAATLPAPSRPASDYVGRYENPDLAAVVLAMDGNQLVGCVDGNYGPASPMPVEIIADDALSMTVQLGPWPGCNALAMQRDAKGQITGLILNAGRVKNTPYKRV